MTSLGGHGRTVLWVALVAVLLAACSSGAPDPSGQAPVASAPPSDQASAEPTATAPPSSAEASASPSAAASAAAGGTTFTLILADGPRAGTWEVTATGAIPVCQNDPARDAWNATWLGPPPLSFIDVQAANDRDPSFHVQFTDEPDEMNFRPTSEVTFEADDRGDTATLRWAADTNGGATFDAAGNKTGEVSMGRAELTIECGSVFRFS